MKAAPDPFELAADILDPPQWESPRRQPDIEHHIKAQPLQPHQVPPPSLIDRTHNLWILQAGRGAGKTEACADYFARWMHMNPNSRGRIIAPTSGDAIEACIRGPSGLQSLDPDVIWKPSAPGGAKVEWPNGSEALVIGTPTPRDVDRLRAGGNRGIDWWEEMAANTQLKDAWDQAALGLRDGPFPHAVASTTPKNTTAFRAIALQPNVVITRATLFDNKYLPASFVAEMKIKYEGTRLGRQELLGELLDDIEGALWNRFMLDNARLKDSSELPPSMLQIVVAVDPAATSTEESDDTGIVVVGWGSDRWGYVLEDRTCHMGPDGWGQRAVRAYHKWKADYIVGETNNGGEMVEFVIATADPNVPFKKVTASRGKQTRAQPIASLYGDGKKRPSRIKHVPGLLELEDQLCSWVPGEENSPDRLDAMVWGLTDLFLSEEETDSIQEEWTPERIGADI